MADICAVDSYCCQVSWDSLCVGEVASVCGQSCEPDPAECVHDKCDQGGFLDPTCDGCVSQVCDADPFCCETNWDWLCVNEVSSVCSETCN